MMVYTKIIRKEKCANNLIQDHTLVSLIKELNQIIWSNNLTVYSRLNKQLKTNNTSEYIQSKF